MLYLSGEKEKKPKKKQSVSNGVSQTNAQGNILQHLVSTGNTTTPVNGSSGNLAASNSQQLPNGLPATGGVQSSADAGASLANAASGQDSLMGKTSGSVSQAEGGSNLEAVLPKLPPSLPHDMEECIQKLKDAGSAGGDEGKCKFFTSDVNHTLLE